MSKGNYYLAKTIAFFRSEGYICERIEKLQRVVSKDKVIYVKQDLFGSDLLCVNDTEVLFVQVKTNRGDIAKGLKKLAQFPCPPCARQVVILWTPREKQPELIEAERAMGNDTHSL